jgi:hypothetical protein
MAKGRKVQMNWKNFLEGISVKERLGLRGWPADIPIRSTALMGKDETERLLEGWGGTGKKATIEFYLLSDEEWVSAKKLLSDIRCGLIDPDKSLPVSVNVNKRKRSSENSFANLKKTKSGSAANPSGFSSETTQSTISTTSIPVSNNIPLHSALPLITISSSLCIHLRLPIIPITLRLPL